MRAFRNVVAYMGFGFYWAWIFVSFNSVGLLGQNLPIDALTSSHLASSVAAILPLLAVFLLRGKIEALPHRALFALVVSSSALASVSTACMQVLFAQPIMHAAAAASAGLFVVGPMLAWGVVYGSLRRLESRCRLGRRHSPRASFSFVRSHWSPGWACGGDVRVWWPSRVFGACER